MKLPNLLPPSLCADVLFYLEYRRTPRDAYRVLSKYTGISVPQAVISSEAVEEHSMEKYGEPGKVNGFYRRKTRTIYLKDDFEARTAIHEYFHHYSKEKATKYDDNAVHKYTDEVISRGRLLLKEP